MKVKYFIIRTKNKSVIIRKKCATFNTNKLGNKGNFQDFVSAV